MANVSDSVGRKLGQVRVFIVVEKGGCRKSERVGGRKDWRKLLLESAGYIRGVFPPIGGGTVGRVDLVTRYAPNPPRYPAICILPRSVTAPNAFIFVVRRSRIRGKDRASQIDFIHGRSPSAERSSLRTDDLSLAASRGSRVR